MNLSARNIELRHLRYFVTAAEFGSFRAAAVHLNLSQPPLTRQIQHLEAQVHAKLFQRKAKGVELTEAGHILYHEAKQILASVDRAVTNTHLAGVGRMGQLNIGIFGSATVGVIPQIIRSFREAYPSVEVVMHNLDRKEQISSLRENRISVGFNRFFPELPDLVWEVVQTECLVIAVPSNHALATRKEIRLQELIDEPLIFYPRVMPPAGFSEFLMRTFKDRFNTVPRVVQEVTDAITAVAFVSSGLGLSLVLDSMQAILFPGVVYVPLAAENRIECELCMITRHNNHSPLLATFVAVTREFCRSLKA